MGRRQKARRYSFYNEMTEPFLPTITAPIPRYLLPGQARARRPRSAIGAFFAAIITFINALLALALVLLLLLLFARFIMDCAYLTFQYSYWITRLSTPLVAPFARYLPAFPFARYTIDLPTLAAMLAYLIGILLVRGILKRLAGK
jgi:YGGT family